MKRNGGGGGGGSKAAEKCETLSTWEIYIDWVKAAVGMLKLSPQAAGVIAGFLWMFVGVLVGLSALFQSFPVTFPVNLLILVFGVSIIAPLGYAHALKIAEEIKEIDC